MDISVPRYLREPPDLPVAVVGCLDRRGQVTAAEAEATVLDMVASGALSVRLSVRRVTTIARAHDVGVHELRPEPGCWADIDPVERALYDALSSDLGSPGVLTMADLQAAVHHRPHAFARSLGHWEHVVASRTATLGLLEGRDRTDAGAAAYERHRAFRRFLRDFSTLEDEPPVAVALWGRYLAFAVLWGLGDRVAEQLDLRTTDAAASPNLATWRAWFGLRP